MPVVLYTCYPRGVKCPMKTLILVTLFLAILQTSTAHALSFMDREHAAALEAKAKTEAREEPSTEQLSPLQMFASPIQFGAGKFMVSPNWANVVRIVAPGLARKMDGKRALTDLWVETQMACDEDLRKLWNDDRPYASKAERKAAEAAIKALKARKREAYKDRAIRMSAGIK